VHQVSWSSTWSYCHKMPHLLKQEYRHFYKEKDMIETIAFFPKL
jgi:hypothetical protein